ncbi:hypothetical protein ACQKND_05780 [Viridibacillus arvi]|uniref:hypothetical protein n=1 Tax=Viridibacillus arvi TaxID=263475 RepID=UPI003D0910CB
MIRSENDRGLDPRLSSKSKNDYIEIIFNSVHFGKLTEDFNEPEEFTEIIEIAKLMKGLFVNCFF